MVSSWVSEPQHQFEVGPWMRDVLRETLRVSHLELIVDDETVDRLLGLGEIGSAS